MNNKVSLILIGGGGHCKSVIDVLETIPGYQIKGILDISEKIGESVLDYKIIDEDRNINQYIQEGCQFIVTVGQIKSPEIRINIFNAIKKEGGKLPVIISSFARVSDKAYLGEGTVVHHHAVINADVKIGENCIINTGAIVEHDCQVGNHCHISTNSTVNGHVIIDDEVFVGSGSTIIQELHIGKNSIIGAGATVFKTVGANTVIIGNPGRAIKQ